MTCRKTFASIILVFVLASQAFAQFDISGTWEARYMGTDITVHVDNADGAVSGVLIVHEAKGDNMYHFTGTLRGNAIEAAHTDGHSFRGHVISDERVVGTLTTKKGVSVEVDFSRTSRQTCGK